MEYLIWRPLSLQQWRGPALCSPRRSLASSRLCRAPHQPSGASLAWLAFQAHPLLQRRQAAHAVRYRGGRTWPGTGSSLVRNSNVSFCNTPALCYFSSVPAGARVHYSHAARHRHRAEDVWLSATIERQCSESPHVDADVVVQRIVACRLDGTGGCQGRYCGASALLGLDVGQRCGAHHAQ
jgi:hypothetical protein